jgi:transposase
MVDVDGAIGDIERVLDEQGKGEALAIVRSMLETLVRKNSELELERLRLLKKHLGKTSERVSAEQLAFLFALLPEVERPADALVPGVEAAALESAEGDSSETTKPKAKKGKHGRKPLPDALPRVEVVIPVAEGERQCAICGKDKKCIGHETSEVLQFEPARFVVEVQKREKLACEDHAEEGVAVAEAPGKMIEKGRPGASLLARVVVGKYEDHEPLNRMKKMFERLGVSISVSTLADWVAAGALALRPIEMLIKKLVLESYVLQADDTGLTVLDERSPGGAKRGHLWYYVGDATLCAVVYTPDWTKEGPGLFLAQRDGGYLVADAYKGYDHIFTRKVEDEELPPPIEVGCNAHARRGFIKVAEAGDPRAAVMLHHYKKLYDIERESKEAGEGPDERLARRQRESLPVLALMEAWCRQTREKEPPKSALSSAVGYVLNQWRALTRFVEDGALPIDNTLVERALRGVAMGRRNYLFAGSDNGALRAATLYTIIATCRLCGVEPMAYVADVLTKLQAGQWPYARLRELVPDEWRKTAPASALLAPKR